MNRTKMAVGNGDSGTSPLVRARFAPGMLLQHDDLELLNSYPRDLSRLLLRSLLGCGVVCGLTVLPERSSGRVMITVRAGLAITCLGDPISVPRDHTFPLDEGCDPEPAGRLWVVLRGNVKGFAPRSAGCSDDDDGSTACTRERLGYEILVLREPRGCGCPVPEATPPREKSETKEREDEPGAPALPAATDCKCAVADLPCYKDHYAGNCDCSRGECDDDDCGQVVLALLDRKGDTNDWTVDHRARRFVRPVLMRDPQVEIEQRAKTKQDNPETAEMQNLSKVVSVKPDLAEAAGPASEERPRRATRKPARRSPDAGQ